MQNEIATKLASELKGGLDAAEAQQIDQEGFLCRLQSVGISTNSPVD